MEVGGSLFILRVCTSVNMSGSSIDCVVLAGNLCNSIEQRIHSHFQLSLIMTIGIENECQLRLGFKSRVALVEQASYLL